jgi:hypothetical protein
MDEKLGARHMNFKFVKSRIIVAEKRNPFAHADGGGAAGSRRRATGAMGEAHRGRWSDLMGEASPAFRYGPVTMLTVGSVSLVVQYLLSIDPYDVLFIHVVNASLGYFPPWWRVAVRPPLPEEWRCQLAVRCAARLLPVERAADFAEEMQRQLDEEGRPLRFTWNIVTHFPRVFAAVWMSELEIRHDSRRANSLLLLAARLRRRLSPCVYEPAPSIVGVPDWVLLQRAIGTDRRIGRVPASAVLTLRLAQRIRRFSSPDLREIISTIDDLLAIRNEAHVIARRLRYDIVASIRGSVEPYASLRARERELRGQAAILAVALRDQLTEFIASRKPLTRRGRRRRKKS